MFHRKGRVEVCGVKVTLRKNVHEICVAPWWWLGA